MEAVNRTRRARRKLCQQLGITNKQLRKRRILNGYNYADGIFTKKQEETCNLST